MNHVKKRIGSFVLVLVLLVSMMPMKNVKAYTDAAIWYHSNGGVEHYCECLDEALMFCSQYGGQVILCEDREFNVPKELAYACIKENTTLIVREGATLTIGENGLQLEGKLKIYGTVDLNHSRGLLYGNGEVEMAGGKMIKKDYTIDSLGSDVCLEAKDIFYSQTLKEADIPADRINWRAPIGGRWEFCQPEQMPQAGTNYYDVVFKPDYPLTYDKKIFERSGKVTTKKVVPELQEYKPLEICAGQNLLDAQPVVKYISPITGEEVPGEFSFEQPEQLVSESGELEKKGTFIPSDDNYEKVTGIFKIVVKETEPQILTKPQVRGQGTYGQSLSDISFLPGKCVNPFNGKTITGTWEWKDASERVQLGTRKYVMLFLPTEDSYFTKEIEVEVTTNPKIMDDIEWPTCSDIAYGERLSDSELSFEKNEYGTFSWLNENVRPNVKNSGAQVVFRPARTDIYDWGRLAGYDEEAGTITFTIPIHVQPIQKELPVIEASDIEEGSCVSGSALSIDEKEGTAEWKEPEQIAEQSGWYPVYFTPVDADNYDWSRYNPDEQGRIPMQVYVKVIEKEKPAAPGSEQEETVDPGDEAEQIESQKQSVSQTKEITPAVTEGERTTFVITQMVSKSSGVSDFTVNATKFVKCKRKGKCIRLSWKKVKGATYQIQYATRKKWKKPKKITVKGTSTILKKLNQKKKYYVRIRCVKKKDGISYYSKWSKKKTV